MKRRQIISNGIKCVTLAGHKCTYVDTPIKRLCKRSVELLGHGERKEGSLEQFILKVVLLSFAEKVPWSIVAHGGEG